MIARSGDQPEEEVFVVFLKRPQSARRDVCLSVFLDLSNGSRREVGTTTENSVLETLVGFVVIEFWKLDPQQTSQPQWDFTRQEFGLALTRENHGNQPKGRRIDMHVDRQADLPIVPGSEAVRTNEDGTNAALVESLSNRLVKLIAGSHFAIIKPDLQAIGFQSLSQLTNSILVLAVVGEKDVVLTVIDVRVGHIHSQSRVRLGTFEKLMPHEPPRASVRFPQEPWASAQRLIVKSETYFSNRAYSFVIAPFSQMLQTFEGI